MSDLNRSSDGNSRSRNHHYSRFRGWGAWFLTPSFTFPNLCIIGPQLLSLYLLECLAFRHVLNVVLLRLWRGLRHTLPPPQDVGNTEDVERYIVVYNLGAGGFSTVRLARNENEKRWVALKNVESEQSASTRAECHLSLCFATQRSPVCGRTSSSVQFWWTRWSSCMSRPTRPRSVNVWAIALAQLPTHTVVHSETDLLISHKSGCRPPLTRPLSWRWNNACSLLYFILFFCWKKLIKLLDVITTGNLLMSISDLDCFWKGEIYRLFGQPATVVLETKFGVKTRSWGAAIYSE